MSREVPVRQNYWREIRHLLSLVNYVFLIAPFLFVLIIGTLVLHERYPFDKADLENFALLVCFTSSFLCMVKFFVLRHSFYLWCFGIALTFFARELHFEGTSAAVYLALLLLLFVALRQIEGFRKYLRQPVFLTGLATGFMTYFLSQSIDQRWWRWFPYEQIVHVPVEETTEIFGHIVVGLTLIMWYPMHKEETTAPEV